MAQALTGCQNAVLVLDGAQNLGKSQFARWLCPLPGLFVDSGISPDDKDCSLQALRSWIWEISELGATTRRADVEALKAFLSREQFSVRPAYGHYEIVKPALASFIGTVNNSAGIFSDPTGNRRFWATTITRLDWSYSEHMDVHQVWVEAYRAYQAGEPWTLTPEEAAEAGCINESCEVAEITEDFLCRHYHLDREETTKFTATADILTTLQTNGLRGTSRQLAMQLAAVLKKRGFEPGRMDGVRSYFGIW